MTAVSDELKFFALPGCPKLYGRVAMSLPCGSLGFLHAKAERPRGLGRIRDRLWLGLPHGRHFALAHSQADDRDPRGQPLSSSKYSPPAHAAPAGHLPQRREYGADAADERNLDGHPAAL